MEELNILIKYHDDGEGETLQKIEKIAVGDWIDLRAAKTVHMRGGDFGIIPLGVSMKLPDGYEAHIVPRSSTFKKWRIIQTNSFGVVDNLFAGNNDVWGMPVLAIADTTVHKNDRICQFRIVKRMPPVTFTEVEHLDGPDRGGFGSTGES